MTDDLPSDPREREIFLRALREYSEACEPPSLMPNCPFSVEVEPSIRGCGEECMDLLGRYGAPRPSHEIDLGDGLTVRRARRPRARRPRNSATRAYDARQVYLADKADGPPARWRLAAIVQGLVDLVSSEPPADLQAAAERRARIDELIRLAEGRGLNLEKHLLPHLRRTTFEAVFRKLLRSQDQQPASGKSAAWASIAEEYLAKPAGQQSVEVLGKAFEGLLGPIMSWSMTTSSSSLFEWEPPAPPMVETSRVIPLPEADGDGQWMIDRFTKTYFEDWSTESLRKEWMYIHGQCTAPCMSLEMKVREVAEGEVALVMADRLARSAPKRPQLARSMVEPALDFLRDGRRVEAAALFEASLHREPDSADALNNLGFCLLPDHPDRALAEFEKALATGAWRS